MQAAVATRWVQRWDAQQERYIADREERFRVVGDVVRWSLGRAGALGRPARVVDLGCGPGSLTTRLATEVENLEIVGVDADPLLLALAAQAGARVVRADLADPAWPDAVGLDGPWDAVVSSTALHWLAPDALEALYRTVAGRLRSGGVFVDADHRPLDGDVAADLGRSVRQARAERAGVTANEDWRSWWDGVQADPDLRPLVDERSDVAIAHGESAMLTLGQQVGLLRSAGFGVATPVWQSGDDHVVVAVR